MTAAVETMAYAFGSEVPWHGLGNTPDADAPLDVWLKEAGLDWTVDQFPLWTRVGGKYIRLPKRQALVRSSDKKVLDVTGANWKPLQNSDAVEFFRSYAEAGAAKLETLGSLRGGKIVWGLAKLDESFTLDRKDKVNGYILLISPHEVGKSIKVQTTSVRVVCSNTLALSQQKGANGNEYSQHHLKEFDADAAKEAIGIAHEEFRQFAMDAETLHNLEMSDFETVRLFSKHFQPVEKGISKKADKEAVERLVNEPKARNKVLNEVLAAYENAPGAESGTGWGALNAATYWSDHMAGKVVTKDGEVSNDSADARLYRSWFAKNGRTVQKIKNDLLEIAA